MTLIDSDLSGRRQDHQTNEAIPLKVGQVGVANFGSYRRKMLRKSGLYQIISLYDLRTDALSEAATEENAQACRSYDELLGTPGMEAVIISTGAKFHAEQAIAALKRGLPVFVEKPLCATPEEIQALLSVQRETNLPVGLGHADHRSDPVALTIRRMIEEGELGKIVAFEKTTAHSGGFHIKQGDWRGDPERNPGGMLFQCGVHALHELMFYFGPATEVSARMRYDLHDTQTADAAICHFSFASGVVGTLSAYHVTPYRHTLSIFGTQMSLYRESRYYDEKVKLLKQSRHPEGNFESLEAAEIGGIDDECGNIRAFYHAVRSGEMQYPSLIDGANAVAAVFAAEEAAVSGSNVKIPQCARQDSLEAIPKP